MKDYMFNNLSLISKYQELYKNGIDVENIKQQVFSGELSKGEVRDYARFRVFLDQCLILLNREKMIDNLKRKVSFTNYLNSLNTDKNLKECIDICKSVAEKDKSACHLKIEGASLFYSLDGKKCTAWEQSKIVRRAIAHAQYSTFISSEVGLIYYFYVDNIDEKLDIHGIVIEEIFHDWVKKFFSNYTTIGIPYKQTCISNYSFLNDKVTETMLWVEIQMNESYNQEYSGDSHPMRELGFKFRDQEELKDYIKKNISCFEIIEKPLSSFITDKQFRFMRKCYALDDSDKTTNGIRTILDPITELSNFIVHLSLLNEVVLSIHLFRQDIIEDKDFIQKMGLTIDGLVEDKSAVLAFRLGFLVLKAMNFAFRMEKNKSELKKYGKNTPGIDIDNLKYPELDYSLVDVTGFKYNSNDMEDFCKEKGVISNKKQLFVLKKLRNSLMHGNIRFKIDREEGVDFVFEDIHSKSNRIVTIEISEKDFVSFLNQEELYKNISSQGICFTMI